MQPSSLALGSLLSSVCRILFFTFVIRAHGPLYLMVSTDSTISHASLFAGDNATSTFLLVLCVGCGGSTLLGLFFIKPALYSTVSEYRSINSEDTRNLNPTLAALEVPILTPEADLARELGDDMEEMDPEHHSAHHHSIKTDDLDISGWHLLRHRDFWLL